MEAQEPSAGSELLGGTPAGALADMPGELLRDSPGEPPGDAPPRVAPADVPPEGASLENV